MLKRYLWLVVAIVCVALNLLTTPAVSAAGIDEATRTVQLNETQTTVLTPKQVRDGKRLFNDNCAICHAGGVTKTNQNVGLDPEALEGAFPPRNNIEGLVDYMKNPTTYDGAESIADSHPSLKSTDAYPKMANLSESDLYAIAGHILLQPKIVGSKWGGGKIYY
ncbi:photosystem II cytochrome c-550 [Leptolyngbya sp. FACHB-261]|uniref:photosystem II cytochrome c-550 n=1 Tax=Leptolyngbya sp. FACHB-261 TaxID=2692806 RepID=UPI001687FB1E|nr:photosystem II cytochrome c-550 [Leptolyngbya sp. FACHB-261]MBD2101572.1 cytochrome c-550 [Leptolyngbya sp. FACHB-261]